MTSTSSADAPPSGGGGTRPRRLLVICHGFPPYYGGAEHVAWYLAREALRTGRWDVKVLTSDIGGRLPAREMREGLDIVRVPAPKREWARHTTSELVRFFLAARRPADRLVRAWKPDLTLAHFSVPAGELARGLWRRHGVRYAVVMHGSDVPGYQPGRFGWVYPLLRPVVRRVWREARPAIAVGEGLAGLAHATWPGGQFPVVENGVDAEAFNAQATPEPGDGTIRLLVVAQLIERKGLGVLLDALARLPAGVRWRLEICGTGPAEAALKAQAARLSLGERIRFRGLVPHDDLAAIFRQTDIFVLPSLQEGLPLALLEAMAAGVPAVTTAVGGVPRVITHDMNGLLVKAGDPDGLALAIGDLAGSAERRGRLAAAARKTALQYAWPEVWARYEQVLARAGATA